MKKIIVENQHGHMENFAKIYKIFKDKKSNIIMIDVFIHSFNADKGDVSSHITIDVNIYKNNIVLNCIEMNKDGKTFENKTEIWIKDFVKEDYSISITKLNSPLNSKSFYRIFFVPLEEYSGNDFEEISFIDKFIKII